MTVAEYTIYTCCVTIVVLLGMMSLFLKPRGQGNEYKSVKRHLAASMFFYAIVFCQCLYFGITYNNTFIANCYIAPFYYYFAYYLFSRAVRKMLHAPQMLGWKRALLTVPLIIVGLSSYLVYIYSNNQGDSSLSSYVFYVQSNIAKNLSFLLYGLAFIGHLYLVLSVFLYSQRFKKNLDNYYAESSLVENVKSRYRWLVVGGYMLFCITSLLNLTLSASEYHVFSNTSQFQNGYLLMAAAITVMLVVYSFIVFNTEYYYDKTSGAFSTSEADVSPTAFLESITNSLMEGIRPTKQENKDEIKDKEKEDRENVAQKLNKWCSTRPYPFLSEGLCLTDLANALEVSERSLSDFLNHNLHQNFNNYINGLRIEYVKQELVTNDNLTISDIAYKSGFNDASALIKVFKRYEGVTPGRYREQNAKIL